MEKGMYVKDIKDGSRVRGIFAIAAADRSRTRKGEPFWTLGLADSTGRIEGRLWSPQSLEYSRIDAGSPAFVQGDASLYRERLQVSIKSFELLSREDARDLDAADFMPASSVSPEQMWDELKSLCSRELKHAPWRKLVFAVLETPEIAAPFRNAPAAKWYHQAYSGGLLEHTLGVAKIALAVASLYPELDRQTLLAGAVFHDLGKIREISSGFAIDYTNEGNLSGHIALGLEILLPFLAASDLEPPLQEHLKHLIISHHGEAQFGSPRLPQTAEAFVLHYADNMDAKIALCRAQFGNDAAASAWSARIAGLDRSLFSPVRTPQDTAGDEGTSWPEEEYFELPECEPAFYDAEYEAGLFADGRGGEGSGAKKKSNQGTLW